MNITTNYSNLNTFGTSFQKRKETHDVPKKETHYLRNTFIVLSLALGAYAIAGQRIKFSTKSLQKEVKPKTELPTLPKPKQEIGKTPRLGAAVQSVRAEVNKKISQIAKNSRGKKGINPSELDKVLTENARKNGVSEMLFTPRENMPSGRIRKYVMPDGSKYVLEAHTTKNGDSIVRLYEELPYTKGCFGSYKETRLYLCKDGKFKQNKYLADESHLNGSSNCIEWIGNNVPQ